MADSPVKPKSAMAAFMENKWVVSSLELITIILSIVSITSSVSAYNKLRNAVVDLQSISDNWAAKPIYAVEVVSGSACPTGFNSMPAMTWPGSETGNCACPSNAAYQGKTYSSSYASCNTNQTSAGCLTDPAVSAVTLNTWKSRRMCYQQGGEPAATFAPFFVRPRPTAGTCPTGYRKCNRGNYDTNKAFCFPAGLKCPVAGLSVGSSGAANFSTNTSSSVAFDDGTKLYVGRFLDSTLPLVDLAVAFTSTSGASTVGPCYYKEQRQNRYAGLTDWGSTLGSTTNEYPGKCKKFDTRYNVIDTVSEYQLLLDNFQNSTACAGFNIKTTTVDYRAGGTACSGTNCAVPAASTLSCASNDLICLAVKRQTKCGKLQHFATQAKDNNRAIGVFGRPEIFWKTSCIHTHQDVKKVNRPVKGALSGQYALMVINIIVNLIVGLIFPILMIINALWGDIPCCPGQGKAEKVLVGGIKNKWSHIFRLIKLIPLISAIMATNKVVYFFVSLAKGNCSDDVTNFTIAFLAKTLPSVRQSNFTTLVMDVLQMLMAVALTCYAMCKKKDSKTEPFQELPSVRTPGPTPGGPTGFDPNLSPQGPAYYPQVPTAPQQYPPPGYVPAPYPQTYPQQPGQMPYYPPPQQQQAPATSTKTMLCVIPKGAKPGDVIELVSMEGVPVKYIVPPNGQPGQHMNITYEVPL